MSEGRRRRSEEKGERGNEGEGKGPMVMWLLCISMIIRSFCCTM